MANFNRLAFFYDLLKKIVFQSTLDKASSYFIPRLPQNCYILIVGGGTGELLRYFKKTHVILYIEQSSEMIAKAKDRDFVATVDFQCADVEQYHFAQQFDCIITPFVLDCFPDIALQQLFNRLAKQLRSAGCWIHADFYPQSKCQNKLIALMYLFFRKTTGLKLNNISNFDLLFTKEVFEEKKNVRFRHGLIQSKYYLKIA
ncbi:MAG: SAM-dependent methyltransferase [Marivirga sp.]|jgi:SAM-dependent methyltransferase